MKIILALCWLFAFGLHCDRTPQFTRAERTAINAAVGALAQYGTAEHRRYAEVFAGRLAERFVRPASLRAERLLGRYSPGTQVIELDREALATLHTLHIACVILDETIHYATSEDDTRTEHEALSWPLQAEFVRRYEAATGEAFPAYDPSVLSYRPLEPYATMHKPRAVQQ